MADTGFVIAGAGAVDDSYGSLGWNNPNNITADDGNDANSGAMGAFTTHYLVSSSHGLSVPSGATIDGIEVRIQAHDAVNASGTFDRVRIVKGGSIGSIERASGEDPSGTPADFDFGGASDLWGETWTDSDVNASGFGVAVTFITGVFADFHVDAVWIKVYYTEGASNPEATGSLKAGAATVSGAAARDVFAIAVMQAQLAAIVAEASRTAKAAGTPKAQAATVEGLAKGPAQEAAGVLISGPAEIDATAVRTVSASGVLASGPATLLGQATIFVQGLASGALKAGAAVVDGTVVRTAKAAGALVSGLAAIEGSSELIHKASGALKAGTAQASGAVVRTAIATGELVSGAAAIVGRLVINIIRPSFALFTIMRDTAVRAEASISAEPVALESELADVLALTSIMRASPVRVQSAMSDSAVALEVEFAPI